MTSKNSEIELAPPKEPPRLRKPEEKPEEPIQSQNSYEEPKERPSSRPSHVGKPSAWKKVKAFWASNIAVAVKPESARDHLGMLL